MSSAGEYIVSAVAGENGNFTNSDGGLIYDDGKLALVNNFTENFNAAEMAEQVAVSTLLGGAMSTGMQEGMYFLSKGIDSVKSGGGDDVKVDTDRKVLSDGADTDISSGNPSEGIESVSNGAGKGAGDAIDEVSEVTPIKTEGSPKDVSDSLPTTQRMRRIILLKALM